MGFYPLLVTSVERVRSLIHGAVRAPGEEIQGARAEDLLALSGRLGRDLPPQLPELLALCNGARIGPGGLFGQRPEEPRIDSPSYLELFPEWTAKGWIPVAGDGCGNCYVLLADGSVGFVDTMSDPVALDDRRHADLFGFVEFILIDDQTETERTSARSCR